MQKSFIKINELLLEKVLEASSEEEEVKKSVRDFFLTGSGAAFLPEGCEPMSSYAAKVARLVKAY